MRQLWMLLMTVPLAACGANQVQTDATSPTVSYAYNDDDDYDEVAQKADRYCDNEYDRDAVLVDRGSDDGSYEATFACQ